MRIRTGNRRRAKAQRRQWKEEIRRHRLAKLRRLVLREILKRMVKQFEDLIIHGSEFSEATRKLAGAFRGFASGGIIQPAAEIPKPDFPGEIVLPKRPRYRMAEEAPLIIQTPIKVINNP